MIRPDENRGKKKLCSKCNRRILVGEDYYKLKLVYQNGYNELIFKLYCLDCISKGGFL